MKKPTKYLVLICALLCLLLTGCYQSEQKQDTCEAYTYCRTTFVEYNVTDFCRDSSTFNYAFDCIDNGQLYRKPGFYFYDCRYNITRCV